MRIGVIGAGRLGICFALLCEEAGHSLIVSDVVSKYCLLYTSPSPRDRQKSRMPSSA